MLASGVETTFSVIGPSSSSRGFEHRPPREPWLMVPEDGTRALTLEMDSGHPVTIDNATTQGDVVHRLGYRVCRARISGNQLVVRGLHSCRNIPIDLTHRGRTLRVLVSVKARKTLPIVAHYVEHGPLLKTRMTRDLLREIIDQANALLFQANVRLSLEYDRTLTHELLFKPDPAAKETDTKKTRKRSLGLVVTEDEAQILLKHRLPLPSGSKGDYPPLNVFFVRKWEREESDPLATTFATGDCIFEDHLAFHVGKSNQPRLAATTLAHEAVHHVLFDRRIYDNHHVEGDPYNLMYRHNARFHGNRLTREQIETINYDYRIYVPPYGSATVRPSAAHG